MRLTAAAFPELRRVFGGYLHEDFVAEHGTAERALRAFQADADSTELRRFQKEAKRFLERTASLDLDKVRALLSQPGCRWMPASRKALVALLSAIPD